MEFLIKLRWSSASSRRMQIAARFFDRSVDTKTFKRGTHADNNPSFYRQLSQEP
jgi:hypothetical protein